MDFSSSARHNSRTQESMARALFSPTRSPCFHIIWKIRENDHAPLAAISNVLLHSSNNNRLEVQISMNSNIRIKMGWADNLFKKKRCNSGAHFSIFFSIHFFYRQILGNEFRYTHLYYKGMSPNSWSTRIISLLGL